MMHRLQNNGFLFITIAIMMISLTRAQSTFCRDSHHACPSYRSFCSSSIVKKGCQLTCEQCKPDQCSVDNGGCEQLCKWTRTEAVCRCFPGFRLAGDNRTCKDIDECMEGTNPCVLETSSHCVNTIGSYSCQENVCNRTPGQINYYRGGGCCTITNETCGVTTAMEKALSVRKRAPSIRVFGGRASAYSAWPWQAQIVYQGYHHCGASLIAHKWLLGASHCFESHSYLQMMVYLGQTRGAHLSFSDDATKVLRSISNVLRPATSPGHNDDIALIELSRPVVYNKVVRPICMPSGEKPRPSTKCWATGFGHTESSGGTASKILREVDVPIIAHETCARAYRGLLDIEKNKMVCAGYSEGKKDTCVGDSGGPLACQREDSCQWYLSGVTSSGKGCATPGYYGVYTNVLNYEVWARDHLRRRNATGLCEKFMHPCKGLENVDNDCYNNLDRCTTYPHYMNTNCKLACCQLKNNEISNCYDDASSVEMCKSLKDQCDSPKIGAILRSKCKKTCKVC